MGIDTDIVVVGGGPAGLAAALAARRRGFRVTVADIARPPIDKACGEGLMPDSIAALEALGVSLASTEAFRFTGIRFIESHRSVEASFPSGFGLGIRRTALHNTMVEAAAGAGVRLLWGAGVTGLHENGVLLGAEAIRCSWVIGADGTNSRVRRWAGLDPPLRLRRRYGFRRHYRIAPWTERMELYWADGFQIYVTPVRDDEVCVAMISGDSHARLEASLARVPQLAERLENAELLDAERGAISASCRLRAVTSGRVALIGDSSGSVDAITGEGLCLAFRQAAALAAALGSGDLSSYEAAHRRIRRRPDLIAAVMLAIGSRRSLRNRALAALAASPYVFSKMLAIHVAA